MLIPMSETMYGTGEAKPDRVARPPLDGIIMLPSKRRRWESNPLKAALQTTATPCDPCVKFHLGGSDSCEARCYRCDLERPERKKFATDR